MKIQMVDVKSQYLKIKKEIETGISSVLDSATYINGLPVKSFTENFKAYLGSNHVIPCANGTDALQIALMALGLKPGDEVIVPAFTYVATAEVIGLLGLKPIMVDVSYDTFNIDITKVESAITQNTKAIVPVNLYGQAADLNTLMTLAKKHNIFVVEDNAQAIGSDYIYPDGKRSKTGTIGHIGCTSFYPSKNLGCYGDGGAIYTDDPVLAELMYKIANHGQSERYYHDVIGCNSRLDSIQAVVLNAKLPHLDDYCAARQKAAKYYDNALAGIADVITPSSVQYATHVYHQYTIKVTNGKRNELKAYLESQGIPTMIYYPVPLYKQKAYAHYVSSDFALPVTEKLSNEVLSLPMHTELDQDQLSYICGHIQTFFS